VQQGVFHSLDILSHKLVVVEGETGLVQLASAQLAQLQHVEGLDILSHRLVVVEGETELVQLAGAQLAQLQRVEGHCCVEAGLVQLGGRGQRRHLHSWQQDLQLQQL
jgi:hypothetical protein